MSRAYAIGPILFILIAGCQEPHRPAPPDDAARRARQADALKKMDMGKEAFEAKRYDEAVTLLEQASRELAQDDNARNLLTRARDAQRKDLFDKAITEAREAAAAKNYERALTAVSKALEVSPGDKDAIALRSEVEFPAQKQRGDTALTAKRFDDAVKAYIAASQLRPDDQAIQGALKQAQEARRQKIDAEFTQALTAAKNSLEAKSYQAALDSVNLALRLVPGDARATALAKEAEFHVYFERGRRAFESRQFAAAVSALEAAGRIRPDDKATADLVKQARAENQRQARSEYERVMTAGRSALSSRRYDEAIRSAQDAQRFLPGDDAAGRLQRDAESKKREYENALNQARFALNGRRYEDAIRLARDADRIGPFGDSQARNIERDAETRKRNKQ